MYGIAHGCLTLPIICNSYCSEQVLYRLLEYILLLKYSSAWHFFMEIGKLKGEEDLMCSLKRYLHLAVIKKNYNISVKKNCRLLQLMIIEAYKKYI
jgi:hypothetical protein